MRAFNFDLSTRLFAGACEVPEGTPLLKHQTLVPLDLAVPHSNAYRFNGERWIYDPQLFAQTMRKNEAEEVGCRRSGRQPRQGIDSPQLRDFIRGIVESVDEIEARRTSELMAAIEQIENDLIDDRVRPVSALRAIRALEPFVPRGHRDE